MALRLKNIDARNIDKWLEGIGKFSKKLKILLGDLLDSIYAPENPEINIRDYNVIIVVKKSLDEKTIDKIYELSAEVCDKINADFAIIPKVVVQNTQEAEEYVSILERIGAKVL